LQHNKGAVSVYKKIGFEVSREFYYFRADTKQMHRNVQTAGSPYTLQPIDINEYNSLSDFWDFRPSWQNSFESISRKKEGFICLGAFADDRLIGYGVFEPSSGDVTQIAVDKQFRRKGIGSLLFGKMLELNTCNSIKIVNTDIRCDSITAFLKTKNIEPTGKQFEMIKGL